DLHARLAETRWSTSQSESGRIRRLVARGRAVHPGSRRGLDSVLSNGAAPGKGGRTALFRWIDRRGNRSGPENFAAHHQARLGFREILANARVGPYNNRKAFGTLDDPRA